MSSRKNSTISQEDKLDNELFQCRDCNSSPLCLNVECLVRRNQDGTATTESLANDQGQPTHSGSVMSYAAALVSCESTETQGQSETVPNRTLSSVQVAESVCQLGNDSCQNSISELAREFGENLSFAEIDQKSFENDIQALMNAYRVQIDEREKELHQLNASVMVQTATLDSEMNTDRALQASYRQSVDVLENSLHSGNPYNIFRANIICEWELRKADDLAANPPIVTPSSNSASNVESANFPMGVSQLANTVDQNAPSNSNLAGWLAGRQPQITGKPIPYQVEVKASRSGAYTAGQTEMTTLNIKQPKMIIGNAGSNDGELLRPWGVCCTNDGNLIVADRTNHRIQIFDSNGIFIRKFGEHGTDPGCFNRPAGVAVDPYGKIFITDKDNHRIQVFTQKGEFVFMFGDQGKHAGQFHYPWDIAINTQGEVAVTDTRNRRVQIFSNRGQHLREFGLKNLFFETRCFYSPRGICFDLEGNILVTDFETHRLLVIGSYFWRARYLGEEGCGPKQFCRPQGVAVDNKGRIAVADSNNNRIQIIDSDGAFLCQFGSSDQFIRPSSVCFTPDGKIVVVDFGNNRLQIF